MTVVIRDGFRWIAEADGVAHATPQRGRALRALCGRVAVDERYGHPLAVRCSACQEVAQGQR
jgi:hypothetical protein